jgi:hypothetical protein
MGMAMSGFQLWRSFRCERADGSAPIEQHLGAFQEILERQHPTAEDLRQRSLATPLLIPADPSEGTEHHDLSSAEPMNAALLPGYSHWTSVGVFSLQPEIAAGSLVWVLRFRGRTVASFLYSDTAAVDLASGRLDGLLGISTAGLNIPSDPAAWNDRT